MSILSPHAHFEATRELAGLLTRHRQLTWEMGKREVTDRYAGQLLGMVWFVAHPLLLMGVYLFLFGVVFRVRIQGAGDYATYFLSGMIPWIAISDSLAKGSLSIISNRSLVKQVVFPIEILAVKSALATVFTEAILLTMLALYVLCRQVTLPWTCLLVPVLLLLQFLLMVGCGFILGPIGAYFKDIKDVIQVFTSIGLYLMPVCYLPEMVPELFRPLLYLNPFSYMAWAFQDAIYYGSLEHPWAWVVFAGLSLGLFYAGYRVFRKLKVFFGSVL